MSLYFHLDLGKIPPGKRARALEQQLVLLSPFSQPGHYVSWQGGCAQLWIWDQAALQARLPQAGRYATLPDSALSLANPLEEGERHITGINGGEWQRWHNSQLRDSRWLAEPVSAPPPTALDLSQRSPIQAADRQLLQHIALAALALVLLASLLIQAGAWLDLNLQQHGLKEQLASLEADNQLQAQSRRRALQSRDLWLARQALFGTSQSELIARIGTALPPSATLWQRYDYQAGQLQIFLRDPSPAPRDYVKRLNATGLVSDIQVQPEPRNGMVTLQATPHPGGPAR